jgi:hypothetical protein
VGESNCSAAEVRTGSPPQPYWFFHSEHSLGGGISEGFFVIVPTPIDPGRRCPDLVPPAHDLPGQPLNSAQHIEYIGIFFQMAELEKFSLRFSLRQGACTHCGPPLLPFEKILVVYRPFKSLFQQGA